MGTAIETEGLSKIFIDFAAVRDFTLTVEEGEIFGLLGPLGSGRSTVLKMLATLLLPSSGDARIHGRSVVREPEEVRPQVGYLPSFFGHYEDMQVGEYLEFYARAYHVESGARRQAVGRVLALADLGVTPEQYIDALDREQKQRLALVKTLVHDPPVLLLDEPMASLDPPARARMGELIRAAARPGRTMLIASNILTDLAGLCDRLGVIQRGRLVTVDRAGALARRLADARVIEVETRGDAERARDLARRHPRVRMADAHGDFLIFSLDGEGGDPTEVIEELRRQGVGVAAYREHEVDLDYLTAE